MKSDEDIVKSLKEGNEQVFESIFNAWFDALCLFSVSITQNKEASEEIVEELFLQIWLNCQINPVHTSVKRYLFQSVYNNSIKYIQRLRRNLISLDSIDYRIADKSIFEPLTPAYPIAYLIAKELEEKAKKSIDSLPEKCREIYILNRDWNLKYDEIAEKLNISVGTVKTQMSRAYSKLREDLSEFL